MSSKPLHLALTPYFSVSYKYRSVIPGLMSGYALFLGSGVFFVFHFLLFSAQPADTELY